MRSKVLETNLQEARQVIRSYGHIISKKKIFFTDVNTISWMIDGNVAYKTQVSNEELKTIGDIIRKFNTDEIILASLLAKEMNE